MPRVANVLVGALLLLGLASADVPAPPAIVPGGIVNAASRMPASLRGGAIAAGARFLIPGVRLGPDAPVPGSESAPPPTLAGVSVQIRQKDRMVNAGLLQVSATAIQAWMPDSAPLGQDELTVVYQGRASEAYKLTVVSASAGFYAIATAPEAVPQAQHKPDGVPGGEVTLFGTGIPAGPLEMSAGGRAAAARVEPLACCKGVEQVTLRVPAAAPGGCFVPVEARTAGGRPSNVIPVSIHPPGQPCHDDLDWFRESVEQSSRSGYLALARVSFNLQVDHAEMPFDFDYGIASFGRQESGQRPFPPLPPLGTCTVFTARINVRRALGQARAQQFTSIPEASAGNQRLDAGPQITVLGPRGAERALARDPRRQDYYSATLGGLAPFSRTPPTPPYLDPGPFTVSAAGGSGVGPFSVTLEVPPALVWKNRGRTATVDRHAGVDLEWKAARPEDAMLLLAMSADSVNGDSATSVCLAPAAAGRFRIPPAALANFPATRNSEEIQPSLLLLAELPLNPPVRIQARGLDSAFAAFVSASARLVKYK